MLERAANLATTFFEGKIVAIGAETGFDTMFCLTARVRALEALAEAILKTLHLVLWQSTVVKYSLDKACRRCETAVAS